MPQPHTAVTRYRHGADGCHSPVPVRREGCAATTNDTQLIKSADKNRPSRWLGRCVDIGTYRLSDLARCLGRPVARGWLSLPLAQAAIAAAAATKARTGRLDGNGDVADAIQFYNHVLDLHVQAEVDRRDKATGAITYTLRPLIAIRAPKSRLLAEAHNTNADAGFPLAEDEVNELAAIEVYWSLQRSECDAG
jgi:hypothetical protein